MDREIWNDVLGYEGQYQVSNYGRVRSVGRKIETKSGRKRLVPGKYLRPVNAGNGYFRVTLCAGGNRTRAYIHRLVAEAFVCQSEDCNVVNHKDFNPANNRADNLEWTTYQGNYDYSSTRGRYTRTEQWVSRMKQSMDKSLGKSVIGTNVAGGNSIQYSVLNDCRKDGFCPSAVSKCCNGKAKVHKGYSWRFADA